MARRIIRDYRRADAEAIIDEISNYISRGRSGYESMLKTTKPNSDLIIDGSLPVDEIVGIICKEIKG